MKKKKTDYRYNYYSNQRKRKKRNRIKGVLFLVLLVLVLAGIKLYPRLHSSLVTNELAGLEYEGEIAIEVNDNKPEFTKAEKARARDEVYEEYSELDDLGRCGVAEATICKEIMPDPNAERESLYPVTPSGWQRINFWNRAHLIGYQLAGENANEKNLITGTTRMNVTGMLPYENEVAWYVKDHKNRHVLMRVEPVFEGDDLVAKGVHMQAWSVEDNGRGVSYNVYIFNIQPGYIINYSDGNVKNDKEHQTRIWLDDLEVRYNGEAVENPEANVEGSTGDVRYIYYTDRKCKNKTSWDDGAESYGKAPSEKGVYYVVAIVSEDNWYPNAASKPAKLTIY